LNILNRYRDAYLVSRAQVGIGNLIKTGSALLVIITVPIGLYLASNSGSNRDGGIGLGFGIIIVLLGLLGGALLYLFGILISAQGQILKASLDSAVNGSPFLTNEERMKIMSLTSDWT
jgi:hypothetical protein